MDQPPQTPAALPLDPLVLVPAIDQRAEIYAVADAWAERNTAATLAEAFIAGYFTARAQALHAPPVTADVERLAPEGKARRTIIAALELFTDQILSQDPEEVVSGEWCSRAECAALIAQLRAEDA